MPSCRGPVCQKKVANWAPKSVGPNLPRTFCNIVFKTIPFQCWLIVQPLSRSCSWSLLRSTFPFQKGFNGSRMIKNKAYGDYYYIFKALLANFMICFTTFYTDPFLPSADNYHSSNNCQQWETSKRQVCLNGTNLHHCSKVESKNQIHIWIFWHFAR